MPKRHIYIAVIISLFLTMFNFTFAMGQDNTKAEAKPSGFADIDNLSDLYEKSKELKNELNDLKSRLVPLCNVSDSENELKALKKNLNLYTKTFSEGKLKENDDVESMISLRGNVKFLTSKLNELDASAVEQLKNIELLKKEWEAKRELWNHLKNNQSLFGNKSAKDVFGDADNIITEAMNCFKGADSPVNSIKHTISELGKDTEVLASELDKFITVLRNRLFKKSSNAMLSVKYFKEFGEKNVKDELFAGLAELGTINEGFWGANAWLFCLQVILVWGIAYYFKMGSNGRIQELGLGFLHKNYIASGLFFGTLLISLMLEHCPVVIKLLFLIVMGTSAAIIVSGKYTSKSEKKCIVYIFAAYIIYRVCFFINMPMTLLRLFVAFGSIMLGIHLFKCNYSEVENSDEKPTLLPLSQRFVNKLLSLALFISFFVQLAGYSALSNHIFEIILKSVLIALLAWVIIGIIKGYTDLIVKSAVLEKYSKIISSNKNTIVKRVNFFAVSVVVFFAFSGMMATWGFFDNTLQAASSIMNFGFVFQNARITIGSIVWAVIVFYLILCASWTIRTMLETDFYPRQNIESGVGISINRLIYYSFVCVAIIASMGILGISYQSFMVVIGALGVGIGFGLQNIVNNFASGLILLFERSIKVGDIVVVGGIWGTVKNLGLRATVIQTFANAEMIVPNSDLVASTVNNWTMSNKRTRFSIKVGVAYGTDPKRVKQILLELAKAHKNVLVDPAPSVVFTEFGDSSLNFELRCWVSDIKDHWSTQDDLMYEIDKKFKENNIEIPFPQRDLYIKSLPEVALKK